MQYARRSERIPMRIPVLLRRGEKTLTATATALNRHGMFIETDASLDLDVVMQFELILPDDVSIKVLAQTKSHKSSVKGVGIEFFAADSVNQRTWEMYYLEWLTLNAKNRAR